MHVVNNFAIILVFIHVCHSRLFKTNYVRSVFDRKEPRIKAKNNFLDRFAAVYREVYQNTILGAKPQTNLASVKPFRDISFWLRAATIYGSYKIYQAKINFSTHILHRHGFEKNETWDRLHDLNSHRMVQLCLNLKGFYLKTGVLIKNKLFIFPCMLS